MEMKTTKISCMSGVSKEIKGTWYKFEFKEERIVPENCNLEEEKRKLWDAVNNEVDTQMLEAIEVNK